MDLSLLASEEASIAGGRPDLNIKKAHYVHVLMWDADDIDSILSDFIEDQVHAFREAIIAGFYLCTLFPEPRIF